MRQLDRAEDVDSLIGLMNQQWRFFLICLRIYAVQFGGCGGKLKIEVNREQMLPMLLHLEQLRTELNQKNVQMDVIWAAIERRKKISMYKKLVYGIVIFILGLVAGVMLVKLV